MTTNRILIFGEAMTRGTFSGRYHDGARIVAQPASGMLPAGHDLLFLVRADGQLAPVTRTGTPAPEAGDMTVSLGPSGVAAIGPVDVP